MEISAPAAAPIPSAHPADVNNRLAALRALQRAIEDSQEKLEPASPSDDGKGQHLDLRC